MLAINELVKYTIDLQNKAILSFKYQVVCPDLTKIYYFYPKNLTKINDLMI